GRSPRARAGLRRGADEHRDRRRARSDPDGARHAARRRGRSRLVSCRANRAQALRDGVEPDRGDARLIRAPFDPPLYLVTDRTPFSAPSDPRRFSPDEWRALEAAIEAGVGAVQLREKDLAGAALLARAERLVACSRSCDVKILINDRADVALAAGAHGVHL